MQRTLQLCCYGKTEFKKSIGPRDHDEEGYIIVYKTYVGAG
jgi:hypothetical protein